MTAERSAPAPGTPTAPTLARSTPSATRTELETPVNKKLTALVLTATAVLGLGGVTVAAAAPDGQVSASAPCCK